MSRIVKFMERYRKAKNPNDPFPWDRVFPSNDELQMFGDELIEFCEGFNELAETADERAKQLRAMEV